MGISIGTSRFAALGTYFVRGSDGAALNKFVRTHPGD